MTEFFSARRPQIDWLMLFKSCILPAASLELVTTPQLIQPLDHTKQVWVMEKRKTSFQDDQNPQKRRCLLDEGVDAAAPTAVTYSFDSLNNDCLVNVFSYLHIDDLNSVSLCSYSWYIARNNETLDQTRTATITCSKWKRSTAASFYTALNAASRTLTANYTKLKILGLEKLPNGSSFQGEIFPLRNVFHLEVAFLPTEPIMNRIVPKESLCHLGSSLPNSTKISLEGVIFEEPEVFASLPMLVRASFTGSCFQMWCHGFRRITDLSFDDCNLILCVIGDEDYCKTRSILSIHSNDNLDFYRNDYILSCCRQLEHLSLKNVTWGASLGSEKHPLPQEMIMKMVRRLGILRWIRSNLTEENVAILQQERPDVTLVSEKNE